MLAAYVIAISIGLAATRSSEIRRRRQITTIVCPDLNVLKHGKIQRSYRSLTGFKASSTYFCDKGFYLDTPSSKRTCLFGQWIGKDPVCLKSC
jgi:hypothetical protein